MNTTKKDIFSLVDRIKSILDTMMSLSNMMKGSLGTTYRRCGKANCWCADSKEKGHPFTKLMWNDATGPKSRSVQEDLTKTISDATKQYQEFKQLRKKLQSEEQKLDVLLRTFEDETSSTNKKKMGFE